MEAHGGYTFCGLAALVILKKEHILNLKSLLVSNCLICLSKRVIVNSIPHLSKSLLATIVMPTLCNQISPGENWNALFTLMFFLYTQFFKQCPFLFLALFSCTSHVS